LTLRSVAKQDGWILESSEDSGKGGTRNVRGKVIKVGDDDLDRQYRSILSFKTVDLPAGATITSVTLKVKLAGTVGGDPFNKLNALTVDLRSGAFADNPKLQLGDFRAASNLAGVMSFANVLESGWYTATLSPTDLDFINQAGLTQFRLRFTKDDNDNQTANFLKLYSGNSDAGNRPQLIITYTLAP
jgi:hypothetical protein